VKSSALLDHQGGSSSHAQIRSAILPRTGPRRRGPNCGEEFPAPDAKHEDRDAAEPSPRTRQRERDWSAVFSPAIALRMKLQHSILSILYINFFLYTKAQHISCLTLLHVTSLFSAARCRSNGHGPKKVRRLAFSTGQSPTLEPKHHEFSRKKSHRQLLILFISVIQMYVTLFAIYRKGSSVCGGHMGHCGPSESI
jgi:hypothetical protein